MGLLTYALLTITSPTFSEVTVFYRDYDFGGTSGCWFPGSFLPLIDVQEESLTHHRRFEGFRTIHKARGFRLVLCVDVWDSVGEYCVQKLKWAIAAENANNGFDNIFLEPLVFYSPRRSPSSTGSLDPWEPLWNYM